MTRKYNISISLVLHLHAKFQASRLRFIMLLNYTIPFKRNFWDLLAYKGEILFLFVFLSFFTSFFLSLFIYLFVYLFIYLPRRSKIKRINDSSQILLIIYLFTYLHFYSQNQEKGFYKAYLKNNKQAIYTLKKK